METTARNQTNDDLPQSASGAGFGGQAKPAETLPARALAAMRELNGR
jgi:hypothetical protein